MAIFFTADQHFGHRNVIEFCKRPFQNVEEMRECLITNHNQRVKKGDLVYHLGDMFWRTTPEIEAHNILDRLNGQHYYINGNHEEVFKKPPQDLIKRFVWAKDIGYVKLDNVPRIVLCHYAMRVWPGSHQGSWQLFGHSHGELPEDNTLSCDVGVDCWNYYPVSLEEIMVKMYKKQGERSWRQVTKFKQLFGCGVYDRVTTETDAGK